MIDKSQRLFDNQLQLEIYLLGYKSQGESIVIFIRVDNTINYAALIDVYEVDKCNKAIELMKKENIKSFDLICWTHPHTDHTKGIAKILNKYASENTILVYPDYKNISKKNFSCIIAYIKTRLLNINPFNSFKTLQASDFKKIDKIYYVNNDGQNFVFEINSLSPRSSMISSIYESGKKIDPNEYSIALLLNFGYYNFLFGSDIEKNTIDSFIYTDLCNLDYIKIPHHGSLTSINLVDKIISNKYQNPAIAVTTIDTRHGLPRNEVIEKYKNWNNTTVCSTNGDGIIKTVIDITNVENPILHSTLTGTAIVM